MDILEGLNTAQKSAVMVTSGPLLILAGAGSGKTKTLIHRIAYLIEQENVNPDTILAVTFTNKAAKEMRQRLSALLNSSNSRLFMPWMGTFHSICVKLLRIDGASIGISNNFIIYDEEDRQSLVKRAVKELGIDNKSLKVRSISSAISSAKNNLVSPEEYEATATFTNQKNIAKIYEKYERLKKNSGALDFDDLLLETVNLLESKPEVRKKWQNVFKHILIDEYQDTNAPQYKIVKLITNKDRNICVVGDDWQSIYSWRGADFTNILNFEHDFPGAKVVKLEQNYRSTGAILEAANNVIKKNTKRTDKKLWTGSGMGEPVEIIESRDEADEAFAVSNKISSQAELGARNFGDFAVLYRTNAQSYPFERAFMQFKIPYQIIGGVRFYDRKEIKDIIAYLRLIYQPNDAVSFNRIVNVPSRGLGATSVERFLLSMESGDNSILSALANAYNINGITPRAKAAFQNLGSILNDLSTMSETVSPSKLIEELIDRIDYLNLLNDGTSQADERKNNIGAMISDALNFADLSSFLEEVALMSSVDTNSDKEKVTLMTIHAAKGLEFPVVFMVGMEEGVFPSARTFDEGPDVLEEERRLCYVGMTRAREELKLSYARSRLQFGQRSYNSPSRFLSDMSVEGTYSYVNHEELIDDYNQVEQKINIPIFVVGDKVKSAAFGVGQVIDANGSIVSVRFNSGYVKKLNAEFARLEKVI
jgi:DNA helicase-2/ATP-dependent DNA helicase PcrA